MEDFLGCIEEGIWYIKVKSLTLRLGFGQWKTQTIGDNRKCLEYNTALIVSPPLPSNNKKELKYKWVMTATLPRRLRPRHIQSGDCLGVLDFQVHVIVITSSVNLHYTTDTL